MLYFDRTVEIPFGDKKDQFIDYCQSCPCGHLY